MFDDFMKSEKSQFVKEIGKISSFFARDCRNEWYVVLSLTDKTFLGPLFVLKSKKTVNEFLERLQ